MPMYDYRCQSCHRRFSRIESMADHGRKKLSCPKCKSTKVMRVFQRFFAKTEKKS